MKTGEFPMKTGEFPIQKTGEFPMKTWWFSHKNMVMFHRFWSVCTISGHHVPLPGHTGEVHDAASGAEELTGGRHREGLLDLHLRWFSWSKAEGKWWISLVISWDLNGISPGKMIFMVEIVRNQVKMVDLNGISPGKIWWGDDFHGRKQAIPTVNSL